jgi:dephospho-CoA kinase
MRKIGITGGIGSGKSTVARYLEVLGYPVFYSDFKAKQLMEADTDLQQHLVLLFGEEAIIANKLNRTFIAEQLFKNPTLKISLEALIHPRVRSAFQDWTSYQKSSIVFNEAAILFETGSYKSLDEIWLVVSPIELRIRRLKLRDSATEDQILQRMQNQWTDEQKSPHADFIIYNDDVQSILLQLESRLNSL